MAQRYLPEIVDGDKRVLLIAGEPVPYRAGAHSQGRRDARQPRRRRAGRGAAADGARARDRRGARAGAVGRRPAGRGPRRHRRLPHRGQRHQPRPASSRSPSRPASTSPGCSPTRCSRLRRRPGTAARQGTAKRVLTLAAKSAADAAERAAGPDHGTRLIGILIIAHDTLRRQPRAGGHARAGHAARRSSRCCRSPPTTIRCSCCRAAREQVARLDTGEGVLMFSDIYGATPCNLAVQAAASRAASRGRRRQPADAGPRVHLSQQGHGDDDQEGRVRRLRRRAAHQGGSGLCSNAKLRSSTSWDCTRARRPSSRSSPRSTSARCACRAQRAQVNAKSIMGVMMLAAGKGAKVHARDRRARRGRGDGGDRRADRRLLRRGRLTAAPRPARHGELRAARHRRLRRHRHRPGAARLARDARGRALHDPAGARRRRDRALRATRSPKCGGSSRACTATMTGGDAPAEFGAFLDVHWMILNDSDARGGAEADHRRAALQRRVGADAADERAGRAVRRDRGSLPARAQGRRRAGGRAGAEAPAGQARASLRAAGAEQQTILVAHDLSPADVIQFKTHRFGAFLTDLGGVTSHTAIVARSLAVPAVVATHNARALIRENELLIVDGDATTSSSSIPTRRCSPSTG